MSTPYAGASLGNDLSVSLPDPSILPDPSQIGPTQSGQSAQVAQTQQQLQRIAQTPLQPVPQAGPDQGSPVRRFLTNFFYGAGQGLLAHVGLPTDYDKQQNAIAQNERQQQLSQQAQEVGALIDMHHQQTQDAQRKALQDQANAQIIPGGKIAAAMGLDPTIMAPAGVWMDAFYKHLSTPPKERTPLSTSQGYFNLDPQGHATPITAPDGKPLMPAKQEKPDTPEQQYLDEYQRTHPGASLDAAVRAYTNATQKTPQPTPQMMFIPNGNGTSTATVVHPGMKIGLGAETGTQFGQEPSKIDKLVQPFDDLVSAADQAHQYAAQNTAAGDAALLLKYVDAVKPAKGFRLTNTELGMFAHTRGMLGDIEALGQRVNNGQMLTPEQKTNMLAIIDMSANHAKQMKANLMQKYAGYAGQGGGTPPAPAAQAQPGTSGSDPFAAFGGKTR